MIIVGIGTISSAKAPPADGAAHTEHHQFETSTAAVQAVCLKTYDRARAHGALPLINSITEHRWDIMDLHKTHGPSR